MIRRTYLDGALGQLHLRFVTPPAGAAQRPPVLLFHETPSTSVEYEPLMRALGRDRAVYAFDTPGYGGSVGPPPRLTMRDYAAALAQAIEQLPTPPGGCVAFGFHTGAVIALELAVQRPDLVTALAVAGFPYRPPSEREARLASLPRDATAADYREKLLAWYDLVVTHGAEDVPLDRRIGLFAEMLQSGRSHWCAYEAVWTYGYEASFAKLRAPTLFLTPHEMLFEQTLAAARRVRHAEVRDLPKAREWALERNADEIAAEVSAFAERSLGPG